MAQFASETEVLIRLSGLNFKGEALEEDQQWRIVM